MNRDKLLALAEEAEEVERPDREVDAEIEELFTDERGFRPLKFFRQQIASGHRRPLLFTASIDTAMLLIPEGWVVASLEWWPMTKRAGVTLREVRENDFGIGYDESCGDARSEAATPALALTAAALRALAGQCQ